MSTMLMLLGQSGSGKSYSLRNLKPEDTLIIKCTNKPLPFKTAGWQKLSKENPDGSVFSTDNASVINKLLHSDAVKKKKVVVIDDFQYVMSNEFFKRRDERGFDKFVDIGGMVFDVLNSAQNLPDETIVIFIWHTELAADGKTIKPKTIGRMLDEKYTPEGLFTIVLGTHVTKDGYFLQTQTSGSDVFKSPPDMFEGQFIPNDMASIIESINNYYGY